MDSMNEFSIEWIKGAEYAGVTVPSRTALKSKLLKLANNNPNDVKIIVENKDGSLFVHVPVKYIKISPPKKMSDERKEAASERFKQMWKEKRG